MCGDGVWLRQWRGSGCDVNGGDFSSSNGRGALGRSLLRKILSLKSHYPQRKVFEYNV